MSVQRSLSPTTNSWSAQLKCIARWASGASGALAPGLVDPVGSSGIRPAHGRSFSTRHSLGIPAQRSQRSESARSRGGNVKGARRTSGGNEGIATAKIRRIKTAEGSGRERGRGSRANAMTRTTGTKQSTGIAEATTRTCSHLQTASCSSAPDNIQHPNPTLIVILISKSSSSNPLPLNLTHCSSSSSPLCRGCCCYLYDLTVTFMHKRDWAHSATRLGPLLTL